MLCKFPLYSEGTQIYVHIFSVFSIKVCHKILNIVPRAYSMNLLFIHPIYISLPPLIPSSQSFPPLHPPPLATTGLFSIFESVFIS